MEWRKAGIGGTIYNVVYYFSEAKESGWVSAVHFSQLKKNKGPRGKAKG
jgi:hypothetical protein